MALWIKIRLGRYRVMKQQLEDYGCIVNKSKEVILTNFCMEGSPFMCTYINASLAGNKDVKKSNELNKSGAYILWSASGNGTRAVYAGKSTNLRDRLLAHIARPEHESYRSDWTYHLSITRIDTEYGFSEDEIASIENRLANIIKDAADTIALNTSGTKEGACVVKGSDSDRLVESAVEFIKLVIQNHFGGFLGESKYSPEESAVLRAKDNIKNFKWYADETDDIVTPDWMVKQMVDMIPAEKFNPDSKFLDLAAKGGEFLKEIRSRLIEAPLMKERFPSLRARLAHIEDNMLYGVCLTRNGYDACIKNLELGEDNNQHVLRGLTSESYGVYGAVDYINSIKGQHLLALGDNGKAFSIDIKRELSRKFGDIEDWRNNFMKFDVIIGNPPYNNDMYLDFVKTGYDLLKDDGVEIMITPAKWQAKGGKKNEDFRANIVPHMKEIVYYPDAGDVFNIRLQGGVCYYIVDKKTYEKKAITSHCSRVPKFSNDRREKVISKPVFLDADICYSICDKVGCFNNSFKPFNPKWVAIKGNINIFVTAVNTDGGGKTSFNVFSRDGNLTMLAPFNRSSETFFRSNDTKCIYSAKTCEEADSFESWAGTRFIRFMLLMRYCTYHNNNDYSWRFVPDPGDFDHIFTDAELYQKYDLTQDEINIIESVIKERS